MEASPRACFSTATNMPARGRMTAAAADTCLAASKREGPRRTRKKGKRQKAKGRNQDGPPAPCFLAVCLSFLSECHAEADAPRPRSAALADESGGREARVGQRDRNVFGVEGVLDPDLAKERSAAHAGPEVGQRVRILRGAVEIVVVERAVSRHFAAAIQADGARERVRELRADRKGVVG